MTTKTFEEYLIRCAEKGITELRMVTEIRDYETKIMIHPLDQSGETIDLIVNDNDLSDEDSLYD